MFSFNNAQLTVKFLPILACHVSASSETSRDALVYAVQPATAMKNSGGVPGHSVIPDEQVMLEHTGKKLKNNPM